MEYLAPGICSPWGFYSLEIDILNTCCRRNDNDINDLFFFWSNSYERVLEEKIDDHVKSYGTMICYRDQNAPLILQVICQSGVGSNIYIEKT